MPAKLVTDPSDMDTDPREAQWARRLKYTTVAELLGDYRAANANIGRTVCPVSDYLAAHLGDDILDVETFIYGHPEWGPWALCDSMWMTLAFNHARSGPNGPAIAAWAQHYCALNLYRRHSFERARPAVQAMLHEPRMRFVSGPAAYVILAYINRGSDLGPGHPNPRKLLEKPAVRAKFPSELDIASFPAPDFEKAA
jgi:hypothetical protein